MLFRCAISSPEKAPSYAITEKWCFFVLVDVVMPTVDVKDLSYGYLTRLAESGESKRAGKQARSEQTDERTRRVITLHGQKPEGERERRGEGGLDRVSEHEQLVSAPRPRTLTDTPCFSQI